jgi:hypothetical protein
VPLASWWDVIEKTIYETTARIVTIALTRRHKYPGWN